jgi:hypothetical protein
VSIPFSANLIEDFLLFKFRTASIVAAALLAISGCSRNEAPSVRRIALLPASVLIADPSYEWVKLAVPLVLQQDLSTTHDTLATVVEASSDAYESNSGDVLQTTVELRQGRLRIEGTLTDLATQRTRDVLVVKGNASAFIPSLNDLARRIDPQSASFSTKNEGALGAYVQALTPATPENRIAALQKAIDLDPAFGLAYISEAQLQSNPQAAAQTLARAASHRAQFTPLDQARFDSFAKRASHAPLTEQASATQALLNLMPNDVEAMTLLGSERFLLGDASDGERLLRRALSLNRDNLNIRQQLSLGLLETKQFDAAAKTLAGLEANPSVLPELAVCALLKGDLARANALFGHYVDLLQAANDQAAPLSHANWFAITQSPARAADFLAQSKFSSPDIQSVAESQSAIYALMDGNTEAAKARASAALRYAAAPVAKTFALVAALTAGSDVKTAPLEPGAKNLILAYGLFFQKQYAESAELWKEIVKESGDTDLRSRAMLASALNHAGRAQEAETVRVQPFVPNLTGADEFAAVSFQEMRKLLKLQVQ